MTAYFIATLRIAVGTIGLLFGYYDLFSERFDTALDTVVVASVGLVGLLSFAGHLIFHKSDAQRLGWVSDKPYYQYEVGFAHLAFAVLALMTYFGNWGLEAKALSVLGYAIYLVQIGILYSWRCFFEHRIISYYFLRHAIATLGYTGLMLYFIGNILESARFDMF
jgi:hypothetical protein